MVYYTVVCAVRDVTCTYMYIINDLFLKVIYLASDYMSCIILCVHTGLVNLAHR